MTQTTFFRKLTPEDISIMKIIHTIGTKDGIVSGEPERLVFSLLSHHKNPVTKARALMQKLVDIQEAARKQMEAAIKNEIYIL